MEEQPPPDPGVVGEPPFEPRPAPADETAAGPAPQRRRRRHVAVGLAVVVASAGAVGAWWFTRDAGPPSHPSAWDPRVTDLVSFVEEERGHGFEHAVHIDFLSDRDYRAEIDAGFSKLSDDDRQDLVEAVGLLRALGLAAGDVDVLEAITRLTGEGSLAFYDPETERIRVKGTELTTGVRGTLVHELTHALQDQIFDLEREGDFPVEAQNETYRPVLEGDASRVETAWAATLEPSERVAYAQESAAAAEEADLEGIPEVLMVFFTAPYDFGQPFVETLLADGGERAVDAALEDPPVADAHLFDPYRYLVGDRPEPVDEPSLAPGEERTDGGPFGALALYLTLAQRVDAHQALRAADAWGGDAYVTYRKDGRQCVRAAFVGTDAAAGDRLVEALESWVAAMPEGAASAARDGPSVRLTSCDPGAEVSGTERGALSAAVTLPLMRTYIALGGIQNGATPESARCLGDRFIDGFGASDVRAMLGATELGDDFIEGLERARAACG